MKKTGLRFLKYALAGILLLPLIGKAVFAEDVLRIKDIIDDEDFKLTFVLPSNLETDEKNQLAGTSDAGKYKLQVTLYKIADAVADPKYDTYTYTAVSGLTIDGKEVDLTKYKADDGKIGLSDLTKKDDRDDWKEIASQISKKPLPTGTTKDYTADGALFDKLEAGLYLVVAHDAAHTTLKEDEKYLGVACTALYEYHFLPQLISVPSPKDITNNWEMDLVKEEAGFDSFDNLEIMTSDAASAGWKKELTVMLKPERKMLFSNLIVEKVLERYDARTPATFVFHVVGKDEKGTEIYKRYVTINFSEAGSAQRVIEHLPVGATFTVTEENTAGYDLNLVKTSVGGTVAAESGSVTILPPPAKDAKITKDNTVWVQFRNSYDHDVIHGYGIENSFTYDPVNDLWPMTQIDPKPTDQKGGAN